MQIGQAAEQANLPVKTVRYYADIDLVKPEGRGVNGYRLYSGLDVTRLRVVARARKLGFSVEDCRSLLKLYVDEGRSSDEVHLLAEQQVKKIDRKLKELRQMRNELAALMARCTNDSGHFCAILEGLAAEGEN